MKQITNHIVMIEPKGFTYNKETAQNNHFQNSNLDFSSPKITDFARKEFDQLVAKLDSKGVDVLVFDPEGNDQNPDAVFPNNWFSIHENGTKVLYPMYAQNRRKERNEEVFKILEDQMSFKINHTINLTFYEDQNLFLEGTGSMVLDRVNQIAYAAISERTSEKILDDFANQMNYEIMSFSSFYQSNLIYHTNVMMCLGNDFALIGLDTIKEGNEREMIINSFERTNKKIIEISSDQIGSFAGNMLQVFGKESQPLIVMSLTALKSLNKNQIKDLEQHGELIFSDLSVIEKYGGGSARCMMAEIFF